MSVLSDEGLLMYQCPHCHLIFDFTEGQIFSCLKCNLKNGLAIFRLYPSLTAIDLLYSLNEMASLASNNQKTIVNNLKNKINEINGSDYHYNTIYKITVEQIKALNSVSEDVHGMSEKIAQILSLKDEQIESVALVAISGDHINRLCKAIVILSASLIEIMFKDYMEEAIKKRTDSKIAANIMSMLSNKSIEEHITQLDTILDSDFKKEIDDKFYTRWLTIKGERNKLIHKNSIYFHWDRTKEVIKTAKESVKVFRDLKNKLLE